MYDNTELCNTKYILIHEYVKSSFVLHLVPFRCFYCLQRMPSVETTSVHLSVKLWPSIGDIIFRWIFMTFHTGVFYKLFAGQE